MTAAVFAAAAACAGDVPGGGDPGGADALAAPADGGAAADADPTLVPVSHARELRGVWVATAWNINFPSSPGLSAAAQQAELVEIVEAVSALRLNAIVFQVRPEADAFYASELEPWSRFLGGTQGEDPGYDPLAFLIEEAHARSIEVHAWLNPYRAKGTASSPAVAPHVSVTMPQHMRSYAGLLWMDPGAEAVQDHTVAVVEDLARRYDIDGIHFDDYFYPYPDGTAFPDGVTYDAYRAAGGTMSRGDWRRDNVNRLVERVSSTIAAEKPHVRFGISPFGIYRPGMPEGIVGLDQYDAIYADPLTWIQQGWLDYVAPQLYWPTTQTAQAYGSLLAWWVEVAGDDTYVFAGNYLSKVGTEPAWSMNELRAQLDISRAHRDDGSLGNLFFTVAPLLDDGAIADLVRDEYYQEPALTPPIAALRDVIVEPPTIAVEGATAYLTHPDHDALRAWVVYRVDGDGAPVIDRIVPAAHASVELAPGHWAISAAGRHGVESLGRRVAIGR